MKFAAIDIGSNAVRLLFCNIFHKKLGPVIKKSSLIRVPIRLGEDVFSNGTISSQKATELIKTMQAFKNLMEVQKVVAFRACATSAMREAINGSQLIGKIKEEAGIHIEIIKGNLEAEIIFSSYIPDKLNDKNAYLYIDVGGGSTELTLFSRNQKIASGSFNIGTLRMLQNNELKDEWRRLKEWTKINVKGIKNGVAIGSGGNIIKLSKLANKKENKALSFEKLQELDEYLNKFSYEERVESLGLNPDRADVITQASKIFLTIMQTGAIKKIWVPQIGLADGIIKTVYEDWMKKNNVKIRESIY